MTINIPSNNTDLGISFDKRSDGEYTFHLFSKKAESVLSETDIIISNSDIQILRKTLDDSINTGKRNYWVTNSKPGLEIQIFPVPLYDEKWIKKQKDKFGTWPDPTEEQQLQTKENAKIIKAQGGYLPPHEFMFRIYIDKKGILPDLNAMVFSLEELQRMIRYFHNTLTHDDKVMKEDVMTTQKDKLKNLEDRINKIEAYLSAFRPFPTIVNEDEMLELAKQLVIQHDKASTSLLQRRLSIGYARAARLLDQLEDLGIIGPSVGGLPRDVIKK